MFFFIFFCFFYGGVFFFSDSVFFFFDWFYWGFLQSFFKIIVIFLSIVIIYSFENFYKIFYYFPYNVLQVHKADNKAFMYSLFGFNFRFPIIFCGIFSLFSVFFLHDFLYLYIMFEIFLACFYFFFFSTTLRSNEFVLKYFVYSSLIESLFLFGISLIYVSLGTLEFMEILQFLYFSFNFNFLLIFSLFFVLFSFFFKIGLVPFHFYVIDIIILLLFIQLFFLVLFQSLFIFIYFLYYWMIFGFTILFWFIFVFF